MNLIFPFYSATPESTKRSPLHGRYIECVKFIACAAVVLSFLYPKNSPAFDEVSPGSDSRPGPISSLHKNSTGITLHYQDGRTQEFKNVDHPRNGSPVTFIHQGLDTELDAYVVDVWRVGKQVVLLSKSTGAFVEVGSHRSISPNKSLIFSSDCWETGCYYQLNSWPEEKKLVFSQNIGRDHGFSMADPINMKNVRWIKNHRIDFEVSCSESISENMEKVSLVSKSGRWQLIPSAPCKRCPN